MLKVFFCIHIFLLNVISSHPPQSLPAPPLFPPPTFLATAMCILPPPGGQPPLLPSSAYHSNVGGQRPTVLLPRSV